MTAKTAQRRKTGLALLFLLGFVAGLASACAPAQRSVESMRLVKRLATQEAPEGIQSETRLISSDGTVFLADLYRDEAPAAGLVLITGAQRDGRNQPQLQDFARALAEAGFAVLVPDIPGLMELRISAGQAAYIQQAFASLEQAGDLPEDAPIGLAALSYSVGPAVLAANGLPAEAQPDFLLGIGGYYDSEAAITFFTTGYYFDPESESWLSRRFNDYGSWVFVLSNAPFLESPEDARLLRQIASLRGADEPVDRAALIAQLTPDGRAVLNVAQNRDPSKTPGLIAALPPAVRAQIEALSLSKQDLSGLTTPLLLLHGENDPILPVSESVRLAAAAPVSRLYLISNLAHVELNLDSIGDGWTLFRASYDLLAARDGVIGRADLTADPSGDPYGDP